MINIYDRKETEFLNNGLSLINECTDCTVLEKFNGEYEINLSYPMHLEKSKYLETFNVIKADKQLFRIYNIDKNSKSNTVSVAARHIFYDLLNYIVVGLEIRSKTCKEALDMILESIGLQAVYNVESDITNVKSIDIDYKNAVEAIFEVVDIYNGSIIRDNFNIIINDNIGENRGFKIKYGRNIVGINEKLNTDNILTKIYPVGKDGLTLPENFILDEEYESERFPSFPVAKKIEFSEIESVNELRETAKNYMMKNAYPEVNYKIDFIKLSDTEDYKDYKELEKVEVGDDVEVRHELMGINLKVNVIGLERDLLTGKNSKVELGQPLSTLYRYLIRKIRSIDIGISILDILG